MVETGVGSIGRSALAESADARLSRREYQYLATMGLGFNRDEVAELYGVTLSTVRGTLTTAYRKLGVVSAVQAFRVLGWLRVPGEEEA